ncbi:spore protease YyaC [Paenibacillus sp. N4]|uniref:spore protease YyaC n=1 Tax=Paenibacillus vietnamensis TaxID=2590547 RepID=UPI001CD0CDAE|nr:spore protease YyaC [Paenibacillus vietnamensis]MCA0756679.1 spore protease YyaC [Paenibacillus vietnamensis]
MNTEQLDLSELTPFLASVAAAHPDRGGIVFICIGTDRSTGDSFGPLVGTMLQERGWPHVTGTLQTPCDAYAVERAVLELPEDAVVIAVDACLGKPKSVGRYLCSEGPLQPGQATGRRLPAVGRYSIAAVVNRNGPKAYGMLQTTSLYFVMQMAKELADAIGEAWGIANNQAKEESASYVRIF